MVINSPSVLNPVPCRAIIINISTKEVSTLALLSVLRYSDLPVLLLDLHSTDGSLEYFTERMASEPRLDICSAAPQKHGYMLDWLFRESRDEALLLVDSDLELIDADILTRMLDTLKQPEVFGAGAIHGPEWMGSAHGLPSETCLFQERMWIPFTLLRVASIQKALTAGFSFINRWVPNEIVSIPWLSSALSKRFFLPVVKNIRASFLRRTRAVYQGRQPNLVCCDTGADIFCHLKYDQKARFVDFGIAHVETLTHHYHGVTRRQVKKNDRNATGLNEIMSGVLARLRSEYGVEF